MLPILMDTRAYWDIIRCLWCFSMPLRRILEIRHEQFFSLVFYDDERNKGATMVSSSLLG